MNRLVQLLLYGAFAVIVGYLSLSPGYRYGDPGLASIKLSLSHAADRVEDCVKLTPQQINERALAGEPLNERDRLLAQVPPDRRPALQVAFDRRTAAGVPSGVFDMTLSGA